MQNTEKWDYLYWKAGEQLGGTACMSVCLSFCTQMMESKLKSGEEEKREIMRKTMERKWAFDKIIIVRYHLSLLPLSLPPPLSQTNGTSATDEALCGAERVGPEDHDPVGNYSPELWLRSSPLTGCIQWISGGSGWPQRCSSRALQHGAEWGGWCKASEWIIFHGWYTSALLWMVHITYFSASKLLSCLSV